MRIAKFALCFLIVLTLVGATPLNPTVTLRSNPGAASEDCYGDVTPTTPTAPSHITAEELREVPVPVALEAPPRADLRGQLRAAHAAATRGDRESFLSALDAAKRTLATYPTGGERSAALDVIRVYDDLARVWNYQQESPTGAFFDESSEVYTAASGYRGYEEAIRRDTFTAGGRRIYPARETREFLVNEANTRLDRLGLGAPATKTAERPRRRTPAPSTAVDIEDESKALPPITRRRTPSTSTSTSTARRETAAPRRQSSAPSAASSSSPSRSSRRVAAPSRRSTAPTPVPPPPPPVDHEPAPAAAAPAVTPVPPPPAPATDMPPAAPIVDTSATAATEATGTTAPTATAGEPQPAPKPITQTEGKSRNLLIPIILIVIGIGVLAVLFRASS